MKTIGISIGLLTIPWIAFASELAISEKRDGRAVFVRIRTSKLMVVGALTKGSEGWAMIDGQRCVGTDGSAPSVGDEFVSKITVRVSGREYVINEKSYAGIYRPTLRICEHYPGDRDGVLATLSDNGDEILLRITCTSSAGYEYVFLNLRSNGEFSRFYGGDSAWPIGAPSVDSYRNKNTKGVEWGR
jgi:hypothetical protein